MRALSANNIAAAMGVIDTAFLRTPLLSDTSLNRVLEMELFFKVETLNPIRSFKGRGTDLLVAKIRDRRTLICASAGNFGQGLARAAAKRKRPVVVFVARNANPLKVQAMRDFGAEVRQYGADFDAAKEAARRYAASIDAFYVEDGALPEIAEGAGTMALEISEVGMMPEQIIVPLGNGALATGIGCWCRHAESGTRVIAVVAENAPAMRLSFAAREPVSTDTADTVADGIAVREPVAYAVASMAQTVDEVLSVREETIVRAMRLLHGHLGLVVEPAGAAGLAAVLEHHARFKGKRAAIPLCGSNVTQEDAKRWFLAPRTSGRRSKASG